MDKRSRAYNIYKAGLEVLGNPDALTFDPVLLQAVAGMLDYATKKPTKKKDKPRLKVSPAKAFEIIKSSNAVNCEPVDSRWFGRLGKEIAALDLDVQDVQDIADYLAMGGWKGATPDMGTIIRFMSKLAPQARTGSGGIAGKVLKHV